MSSSRWFKGNFVPKINTLFGTIKLSVQDLRWTEIHFGIPLNTNFSGIFYPQQTFDWGGPNYLTEIYSELIFISASSLTYILRRCFIQDQHFVEEDPMICPKSTESIFTSSSMLLKRGFFTQDQHFVKKDPIICPRSQRTETYFG